MDGISLGDAITEYILCCRIEGKSPKTISWYRQKLEYLDSFLRQGGHSGLVHEISTADLRYFINHLQTEVKADANHPCKPERNEGLSPHTLLGYVRTLKAFFAWTVRDGLLGENPMAGIRIPKVPRLVMKSFSDSEVRDLLDGFDRRTPIGFRNYTIVLLLLDTGIRASELTGLRISDLHLEEGYVKVLGKGRKERIVPLGYTSQRTLWNYLRKFRPKPALPTIDKVFLSRDGQPMKIDWLYKIVSRACRRAGIDGKRIGPHTCRHTFARQFLMNGGDLLTLQRILGHSTLDVVRLYVDLDTRDLLKQQRRYSPMDTLYSRGPPR
jgi:site-specific recombinase XerD